jgi:hypothetical protein
VKSPDANNLGNLESGGSNPYYRELGDPKEQQAESEK